MISDFETGLAEKVDPVFWFWGHFLSGDYMGTKHHEIKKVYDDFS